MLLLAAYDPHFDEVRTDRIGCHQPLYADEVFQAAICDRLYISMHTIGRTWLCHRDR